MNDKLRDAIARFRKAKKKRRGPLYCEGIDRIVDNIEASCKRIDKHMKNKT